ENFAFQQVVDARGKDHPVVNQNRRAEDDGNDGWNGDVRPCEESEQTPAKASLRLFVTNYFWRWLRYAPNNARDRFVWWPPHWHSKSRGRSVWRRAVSSDAKRLGWYCLETIEPVYCIC